MEYYRPTFDFGSHAWKAWEQIALFAGVFIVAAVVWYSE